MMLCEAAVVEVQEDGEEVLMRSCGEPAEKILKALIGPQEGQEHPCCRAHAEWMLRDYPDGFVIINELGYVA